MPTYQCYVVRNPNIRIFGEILLVAWRHHKPATRWHQLWMPSQFQCFNKYWNFALVFDFITPTYPHAHKISAFFLERDFDEHRESLMIWDESVKIKDFSFIMWNTFSFFSSSTDRNDLILADDGKSVQQKAFKSSGKNRIWKCKHEHACFLLYRISLNINNPNRICIQFMPFSAHTVFLFRCVLSTEINSGFNNSVYQI